MNEYVYFQPYISLTYWTWFHPWCFPNILNTNYVGALHLMSPFHLGVPLPPQTHPEDAYGLAPESWCSNDSSAFYGFFQLTLPSWTLPGHILDEVFQQRLLPITFSHLSALQKCISLSLFLNGLVSLEAHAGGYSLWPHWRYMICLLTFLYMGRCLVDGWE